MRIVFGFLGLATLFTQTACGPSIKNIQRPFKNGIAPVEGKTAPALPTEQVPAVDFQTKVNPSIPEPEPEIPAEFDTKPPGPVFGPGAGPVLNPPGNPSVRPSPRPGPVLSLPGLLIPPDHKEILETGRLIPTIYYSPYFDEDAMSCQESARVPLRDTRGNKMMDVCPKTHASCGFQGSCVIKKNKIQQVYNVIDQKNGEDRFAKVSARCKFGYGVHDKKNQRSFCLEPYITIAADLSIYNPGDVIFLPKARGMELPSGKMHDGFFVVADAGRLIKGKGRFDFFSGHQHWKDFQNPLAKIRLHDKDSNLEYHRIEGPSAERFRRTIKNLISD